MNTTTINNHGLPKLPQANSKTGGNSSATTAASADASTAAPRNGDQLKLTDSARALQEVARQHEAAPIDAQRVEQVRRALANGSYKIDAGRVAERMLALDQQLGGPSKA
ncbi:MAG: flagellar biosynthesis anti-sigma factor FlgM [Rhodanobacter sp.]|nr:MAG: flagellar biosynthesis anti-sigma factor FlgM [Rhodanobacter sp.]TAM06741.1 MAG: flagellar biosynthesis anti-sigma factor FlgM [Rhodanobacter sp.]TAM40854.1 MAG: flagellar biosynthesis anti-sigma factor FlgM [Rhodanobacter sp.]TAN25746.1 MAG: flagellar biosynthesis anti-sigma factor FlgM [Rhodanobacter sp.]